MDKLADNGRDKALAAFDVLGAVVADAGPGRRQQVAELVQSHGRVCQRAERRKSWRRRPRRATSSMPAALGAFTARPGVPEPPEPAASATASANWVNM